MWIPLAPGVDVVRLLARDRAAVHFVDQVASLFDDHTSGGVGRVEDGCFAVQAHNVTLIRQVDVVIECAEHIGRPMVTEAGIVGRLGEVLDVDIVYELGIAVDTDFVWSQHHHRAIDLVEPMYVGDPPGGSLAI